MHPLETTALATYYAALLLLVGFGAHRLWLTWLLARRGLSGSQLSTTRAVRTESCPSSRCSSRCTTSATSPSASSAPQRLSYPRHRFEVQVVDDSTDDTRERVDRVVRELAARGEPVSVVRRTDRVGYKAGALAHAMQSAKGELLCVFDADFVPPADFLMRLVGHFGDAGVGMVQARWDHLNSQSSLLTRAQAVLLDGHFLVEQPARARGRRMFHFNGTAGIWRKDAIVDAGGWAHDTITEDLDLSIRAQLAGARHLPRRRGRAGRAAGRDERVPLTAAPLGKGSIECLKKLAVPLLRSDEPLWRKAEALVPPRRTSPTSRSPSSRC